MRRPRRDSMMKSFLYWLSPAVRRVPWLDLVPPLAPPVARFLVQIQFYFRGPDHRTPFLAFGAHERAKTFGRVLFECFHAERRVAVPDIGRAQCAPDFGVQPRDYLPG